MILQLLPKWFAQSLYYMYICGMKANNPNPRFFHELEQQERDTLILEKKSIGYIMENFKQPDWCGYNGALSFQLGCWSLCDMSKDGGRTKVSEQFCKECDCFISKQDSIDEIPN